MHVTQFCQLNFCTYIQCFLIAPERILLSIQGLSQFCNHFPSSLLNARTPGLFHYDQIILNFHMFCNKVIQDFSPDSLIFNILEINFMSQNQHPSHYLTFQIIYCINWILIFPPLCVISLHLFHFSSIEVAICEMLFFLLSSLE